MINHLDEIVKTFQASPKPKTPKTVWRVKINGQFVSMDSGKTVWKRIGDAKNAVHNHINDYFCRMPYGSRDYRLHTSQNYLQKMIEQKIIEFVELELPLD